MNRAEVLAGEIKDLQGQLADYNMVHYFKTVSRSAAGVYILN